MLAIIDHAAPHDLRPRDAGTILRKHFRGPPIEKAVLFLHQSRDRNGGMLVPLRTLAEMTIEGAKRDKPMLDFNDVTLCRAKAKPAFHATRRRRYLALAAMRA